MHFPYSVSYTHLDVYKRQTSNKFNFKVKFDKDIPVENIDVFYIEKSGNYFEHVNYCLNISENEIEVFGENNYVIEVSFPTIIFSLKEKKTYHNHMNIETETAEMQKLFFLVNYKGSFEKDFDKELKFSHNKPNIRIKYKNIQGRLVYDVESIEVNYTDSYFRSSASGNSMVKINISKNLSK